ncbi:aminotransferase class V-fold PLP-dependent enzyme [Pseudomonas aeruginosa]|nr:aminotransferase class V-fold PLP-dependent enzyme [Pseudomonas aeruginosa]
MPNADLAAGSHAVPRDDTLLCSQMLANNELGAVTDVAAIDKEVRARGALLNVDAAQVTGKVGINPARWLVDLMSFSTLPPTALRALARYMWETAPTRNCKRGFTAVNMRAACSHALWPLTRLWHEQRLDPRLQ